MDGPQCNTKLMVFVGFWIVLMVITVCCYAENESDGTYAEIGLSIGNTNWRAAVMVNGSLEWIVDRNGNVDHPSFENINKIIVSNYKIIKSRDGYLLESNNNIFERNGTVYCKVKLDDGIEKEMTPEEIYSDILHDVKELAFQYLKRNITHIFLSVPAYFKQTQEDYIIRNAASKHNLTIVRSVRDPIMAVLAQDHFQKINNNYTNDSNDERTFLVVDLGIRSLALNIVNDDFGFYEILASESYGQLGTERFHMKLRELFVKEFKKQHLLNEQSNILENQQLMNYY
ncbi:predicted protein [Naegleria gruberi]|uniref:Predicted protein n=1 Tax=Naegleria gruberi TaxID=5762 RepID=D2W036_NAEGR|nr:uncharacterized protein NAEGRDRAFT_74718 [Naegleria gruberi]EFC37505.1 predicted protein [Naegleria gruberi]|eukprot:XP_002670249.1 predicted protein [Naegleria gruberi strain NEG-M]